MSFESGVMLGNASAPPAPPLARTVRALVNACEGWSKS
jgi:hypothetical protein